MNHYRAAEKIYGNAAADARDKFKEGMSAKDYTTLIFNRARVANNIERRHLSGIIEADWIRFQKGNVAPAKRIDFTLTDDGWLVTKFYTGHPQTMEVKPSGFSIDEALEWCEQHGWAVHRWGKTRARAWRGTITPVRTRGRILKMDRARQAFVAGGRIPAWLPTDIENVMGLDLAYDL